MQGWIKLHRALLDWEWYDEPNTLRLFLHLLLKANHKPNNYRGKTINIGETMTGQDLLAQQLKLTRMQIRTALRNLETTNEITIKSSPQGTIIQVVKYKDYQLTTNETTNKEPMDNQRITTNNNDKKEKNDKEEVFNIFWSKYPRKSNKKGALDKWNKLEQSDINKILSNLDDYISYKPFKEYVHPNPTTFLNQRRWEDEIPKAPKYFDEDTDDLIALKEEMDRKQAEALNQARNGYN